MFPTYSIEIAHFPYTADTPVIDLWLDEVEQDELGDLFGIVRGIDSGGVAEAVAVDWMDSADHDVDEAGPWRVCVWSSIGERYELWGQTHHEWQARLEALALAEAEPHGHLDIHELVAA